MRIDLNSAVETPRPRSRERKLLDMPVRQAQGPERVEGLGALSLSKRRVDAASTAGFRIKAISCVLLALALCVSGCVTTRPTHAPGLPKYDVKMATSYLRSQAKKQPAPPWECAEYTRQAIAAQARPIHEFVNVDVYVPGCPPSADTIYFVLAEILEGRCPDLSAKTRFGA